jgi:hypothetical protein
MTAVIQTVDSCVYRGLMRRYDNNAAEDYPAALKKSALVP